MRQRSSTFTVLLIFLVVLVVLAPGAHAFGAGEIPDYAYLADKAFRHGDLENTLKELNKIVGGHHGGFNFGGGAAGILGGIAGALKSAGGGTKFSSMDVKRVYLGNFLCDYSQAMDIAGLTKLTADSLLTIVMALSFMTFGFATAEFQVTKERLGCYLCTTHIDNPKGYGEGYNDPRDVYPGLRPPVDPVELELNDENGMKNYIATEGQHYDTSTALLKRVFRECIENGRRSEGRDGPELYEAFRLLGQGLHTCEDLLAHSNWCELTLRKLGHQEVFCHVGDNVTVNSPQGPVPPLVTGTFGSADFIFSLLGEATDHLSEASLTDLTKRLNSAKNTDQSESPLARLGGLLKKIPMGGGGGDDKLQQGEEMKAKAVDLNASIDSVAPEEVQKQLWEILVWRDGVMKDIAETIQNIPGLEDLLDQLTESLNVYVFTILEPFMTPILQNATSTLQSGSSAVIDSNHENQYEVFNDPNASDPSHSLLSKDHFALILNEPAGLVAIVVVKHVVNLVVQAWYDDSDIDQVIEQVLEVFYHPFYASGRSKVQHEMEDTLRRWIEGMADEDCQIVLQNLTKEAVRAGKNNRAGHENDDTGNHAHASVPSYDAGLGRATYGAGPGSGPSPRQGRHDGGNSGRQTQESSGGYGYSGQQEQPSHNRRNNDNEESGGYGQRRQERTGYGENTDDYGQRQEQPRNVYGGGRSEQREEFGYGGGGRSEERNTGSGYGQERNRDDNSGGFIGRRNNEEESYGYTTQPREERSSYQSGGNEYGGSQGRRGQYGENRQEGGGGYGYGGQGEEEEHHNRNKHKKHDEDQAESFGYGGERNESSYGGGYSQPEHRNNQESEGYGGRRRGGDGGEQEYGYGGSQNQEEGHRGNRRHRNEEDETFGAERLNINEENREERRPDYYESQY